MPAAGSRSLRDDVVRTAPKLTGDSPCRISRSATAHGLFVYLVRLLRDSTGVGRSRREALRRGLENRVYRLLDGWAIAARRRFLPRIVPL